MEQRAKFAHDALIRYENIYMKYRQVIGFKKSGSPNPPCRTLTEFARMKGVSCNCMFNRKRSDSDSFPSPALNTGKYIYYRLADLEEWFANYKPKKSGVKSGK